MKPLSHRSAGCQALNFGTPVAIALLLLAVLTVSADTPCTATGWVIAEPFPGIWCALGQGVLRGNTHLVRAESSDWRLTGRRLVCLNGDVQADDSILLSGTEYLEVGTWDATGTNFTPSGGVWQTTFRGVMQTDNSLQLSIVGYGCGGSIDGLRIQETMTRKPAADLIDPTIPYLYTGTLKPAPVNTTEVVDNFDDGSFSGSTWGNGNVVEANGQFAASGSFYTPTTSFMDSFFFGGPNLTWSVPDGMTREWQADLVSLDDNPTHPILAILSVGSYDGMYGFHKGPHFAYLWKWAGSGFAIFACDEITVRNTNVILTLALTRVHPNLVITASVLDKANPNTVLYQRRVMDTPNADPTLSPGQFEDSTGMSLVDVQPDYTGTPFTSFLAVLGVFQCTDGAQPAPRAVFDNFELRTSEIAPIGIERAVRLSWPVSAAINYAVEAAPTVLGPWLPVQELEMPGLQKLTVPLSQQAEFFRLRQAP